MKRTIRTSREIMDGWTIRDHMGNVEEMYGAMSRYAAEEHLEQTQQALPFMRDKHAGQFRKKSRYSDQKIPYIYHPLLMACQAHAAGIRDDNVLAAMLLHDVCEDCDVSVENLPFNETVRAAVDHLTFRPAILGSWEEARDFYYRRMEENPIACLVKVFDRCSNVSTMCLCFDRDRMIEYLDETDRYILPMLDRAEQLYPQYSGALFIVKYHLMSVDENIKALFLEEGERYEQQ